MAENRWNEQSIGGTSSLFVVMVDSNDSRKIYTTQNVIRLSQKLLSFY